MGVEREVQVQVTLGKHLYVTCMMSGDDVEGGIPDNSQISSWFHCSERVKKLALAVAFSS